MLHTDTRRRRQIRTAGPAVDDVLRNGCIGFLLLVASACASAATGIAVPELAKFDDTITLLMQRYSASGASLAVMKDGRLVYARGFGLADRDAGTPVLPTTPFRVASLTKQFTSAAVMKLVEDGKLDLDAKIVPMLHLHPVDPLWNRISVRNLLEHSGGWDRNAVGAIDPPQAALQIAAAMGTSSPPPIATTIEYMTKQYLDFAPGTAFVYSNFGYMLLGRIIENVTGVPYATYVATLLQPSGATNMFIGGSRLKDRHADESHYYSYPSAPLVDSVYSDTPGPVARPDGGFALESYDSIGAWVLSPIDHLRILRFIDPRTSGRHLLAEATVENMLAKPNIGVYGGKSTWYAKGWYFVQDSSDGKWWHSGNLSGTVSYIARYSYGVSYVAVFNTRDAADALEGAIDPLMRPAIEAVQVWPSGDQFPAYAAAPNYGGPWWGSPAGSESGWGLNFAHQGNVIFATWFTYDANRKPTWFSMVAPATSSNTFAGDLYKTEGPPFDAPAFDPSKVKGTKVGGAVLTFNDNNNATFEYTVGDLTNTKSITREVFGVPPFCAFASPIGVTQARNYQDLWWRAPAGSESGWGLNLSQQESKIFATWFTYGRDGQPMWLSATATKSADRQFVGTLVATTGPPFSSVQFDASTVTASDVGTVELDFSDGNTGTFTFNYGGQVRTIPITRQVFREPGTTCL